MAEETTTPSLSDLEAKIAEAIKKLEEASAVDIAKILYPEELEIRKKTSLVSVILKRLEKKGVVRLSKKIGKRAVFRISGTEQERGGVSAQEVMGVEKEIANVLEKMEKASASDIAPIIFKGGDIRKKTSEVSVYLRRMEEKGYVSRLEKIEKKAYYSLKPKEEAPPSIKAPEIEEMIREVAREPEPPQNKPFHLPRMILLLMVVLVFVGIAGYFTGIISPQQAPTGFAILQHQEKSSYFELSLAASENKYNYFVKNIYGDKISDAVIELKLPGNSNLSDNGNATLENREGATYLIWKVGSFNPNDQRVFSFSGDINGSIEMVSKGFAKKSKEEKLQPSVEIETNPGKYAYNELNLNPASYISSLTLSLSAKTRGDNENVGKENTIYAYLDIDSQENGNEDLIGQKTFTGNWSGELSFSPSENKYNQSPFLALHSDLPATVNLQKVAVTWTKKEIVSDTAKAEIVKEAAVNASSQNVTTTQNVTNVTQQVVTNVTVETTLDETFELTQEDSSNERKNPKNYKIPSKLYLTGTYNEFSGKNDGNDVLWEYSPIKAGFSGGGFEYNSTSLFETFTYSVQSKLVRNISKNFKFSFKYKPINGGMSVFIIFDKPGEKTISLLFDNEGNLLEASNYSISSSFTKSTRNIGNGWKEFSSDIDVLDPDFNGDVLVSFENNFRPEERESVYLIDDVSIK